MIKHIISAVIGYFLGSVSISIILSKTLFKTDVRTKGSGNAGATNVARVFGMKAGAMTLIGDVLKTVISMLVGKFLGGDLDMAIAGIFCVVGHCWPVYFKFKGGKGVSVGAAVGIMLGWKVFVTIAAAFFAGALITKRVSVGSVCAAATLCICAFIYALSTPLKVLAVFTGIVVIFAHRGNIKRLIDHTEPEFSAKK